MATKKKTAAKKVVEVTEFTAAQQAVISHRAGPMLAGAVAGAGKSSTLVERTAQLIASGVPADRILLSAFSKDASVDLNRKLKKRLNLKGDVEIARTLHSLALSIWRSSPTSEGFGLDKGSAMYGRAIRQGARSIGVDVYEQGLVTKLAAKIKNDCLTTTFTEGLRALGQTPSELVDAATEVVRAKKNSPMHPGILLDLYFAAEAARTEGTELPDGTWSKFCGFDDLLAEAVRIFGESDELRIGWQQRFDYVIVDEAQDLCEAQWRIVNTLAEGHRNIVVCGDTSQCVYSFRGAKPQHFLSFPSSWPHARTVYMDANFRSGKEVIRVANAVLEGIPDTQKLPMKLLCTRDAAGYVGYRETENPWAEARDIAQNILKHRDAGVDWRDQAILVRRNDQSAQLELELLKARVPARVVRGQSFFASREAKTALAYLRLIANQADADDFEQAIMNPPKYLGRAYVDKIVLARGEESIDWLDVMDAAPITNERKYNSNARDFMGKVREWRESFRKGATPLQLFMKVCEKTNWTKWLEQDGETVPDNDAALNFDRVRDFLASYDSVEKMIETVVALKAAQKAAAVSRNAVSISTAHACVDPSTMIETDHGVMEIRDVHDSGTIGTASGPAAFHNVVRNESGQALKIIADGGYNITVTPDHGLMSWTGRRYEMVAADSLKPGSWLRLRLGATAEPGSEPKLPGAPAADVRAVSYPLPERMTADLAEFLGLMVADGTIFQSGFRLTKRHEDVRDRTAALATAIFGCHPALATQRGVTGPKFVVDVSSTFLRAWFEQIGGLGPRAKTIPQCILRSSVAMQAAFMRGLMEDGTVNLDNNGRVDHVAWHTVYERLGEMVQNLLLRQSIIATRFIPKEGTGWRVAIYGDDVGIFRDRIGFVSEFKNERLRNHWFPAARGNRMIPVDPDWIRSSVSRDNHRFDRQNAITRGHVSRPVAGKLGLMEELQFHHVQISSIKEVRTESMCVEVPSVGRFLQNGFDGSNCKGLEYSVVYIAGMVDKTWPTGWGGDMTDERRVFYVAVTRARDELWLNGYLYKDDSATDATVPSPYLKEIGHTEPTDRIGRQTIAAGQMTLG